MQAELLSWLEEKKMLLLHCEQLTELMCICPIEQLEDMVQQREEDLEKLRALDLQIQTLVAQQPEVESAISNSCNRQGMPPTLARIFDASLGVKAVANRIVACEEIVRERIKMEQQLLLEKIENINTGGSSIAGKYSKSASAGIARPMTAPRGKYI